MHACDNFFWLVPVCYTAFACADPRHDAWRQVLMLAAVLYGRRLYSVLLTPPAIKTLQHHLLSLPGFTVVQ
jgi:hypothetical protein